MKAKVTKAFPGVRDGETYPVEIAEGETIQGDLAATAVRQKWATEIKDSPAPRKPRKSGGSKKA